MNFAARMPPNHQFILNNLPMEPLSRTYQYRKIMKPMLERKRRARINKCLDELKDLMTGTLQADGENVSKLEKADILELTVRHLQRLREKNALFVRHSEALNMEKYWAGFQHCVAEVAQFLTKYDQQVSGELVQHISSYVPNIRVTPTTTTSTSTPPTPTTTIANSFRASKAVLSRELAAYNQRIYNKLPVPCTRPMSSLCLTDNKCLDTNQQRQQVQYEVEVLKREIFEEVNNVWRPW